MSTQSKPTVSRSRLALRFANSTYAGGAITSPSDKVQTEASGTGLGSFQTDLANGVFVWQPGDTAEVLYPVLEGPDNCTALLNLYRLEMLDDRRPGVKNVPAQYTAVLVVAMQVIACTKTGSSSAGAILPNTMRYCDQILSPSAGVVLPRMPSGWGVQVMQGATADNEAAGLLIDSLGTDGGWMLRGTLQGSTGPATGFNFLSRAVNSG